MSPEAVRNAIPLLGTVAVFGALLPGVEQAWNADSHADAKTVRNGEAAFAAGALGFAALASYGQGNLTPLVLTGVFVAVMIVFYEHALRSPSPKSNG